ncbi:TRAP transporter substrate-binding protein [Alkalihalobacillus sp. MEB130]|uniref:TRAP transporter substrate-binding protein n=1 Tax=Alkalihalobacillus sp. MEB130 TaxID=2976704 RepID=UPI0028DF4A74|nr:TRAP transporter substrate-binding protein [Alkalihalobacillus sp. MEB130]MDT8861368.1 TRAP transporter substrate-binding protein [Alkalihalobacillus sp. MEB130]
MGIRRTMLFMFVFIGMLVLAACGSSESSGDTGQTPGESTNDSDDAVVGETTVLRMAHLMDTSNVWHITAEKFKEEIETLSEGRYTIEIYPNGEIGTEADMYQQLGSGNIDLMFSSLANLTGSYEEFGAWFVPYLFDNLDQAYEMGQTDEAKQILDLVEPDNVVSLGYVLNGMRQLNTVDPVTELSHYQGERIRVVPSPTIVDWYNRIGASPTPMSFGEVFSALQQGVIEGVDNDLTSILSGKHYEVAKHVTLTNHFAWGGASLVNADFWNTLSEEDQLLFQEAYANTEAFNVELAKERTDLDIAELEENGVEIHELENRDEILTLAQEMQEAYNAESEIIAAFIDKGNEISGR